jgi:hypothetical protein
MVDIAFRRRLQLVHGGRNYLLSVPPEIAEAFDCEDVVFVVRDGDVHLIPAHKEARHYGGRT